MECPDPSDGGVQPAVSYPWPASVDGPWRGRAFIFLGDNERFTIDAAWVFGPGDSLSNFCPTTTSPAGTATGWFVGTKELYWNGEAQCPAIATPSCASVRLTLMSGQIMPGADGSMRFVLKGTSDNCGKASAVRLELQGWPVTAD
jgi:hypothetical protein